MKMFDKGTSNAEKAEKKEAEKLRKMKEKEKKAKDKDKGKGKMSFPDESTENVNGEGPPLEEIEAMLEEPVGPQEQADMKRAMLHAMNEISDMHERIKKSVI